jgi:hypothetical protein
MHIPLIAGRALREDDSGKVAVINQKMAYLLWPGENPIGREFTDNGNPPIRVIGIVGNVHSGPLEMEPMMQYYSSLVAFPGYANSFAIRIKTDPLSLLPAVERTIWRLDPEQAVSGAKTMEHIIRSATWSGALKPICCWDSRGLLCSFLRSVSSAWHRFRSRAIRASSASAWRSAQQAPTCSVSK